MPDNEKAACVAEADLGTIAFRNAVVLGAQRRADAAPATIEGLRSLRELDSGYRSVFAGPARFQAGGLVESVWLAVQPVISRRRAAIEGPLRPQIIARMNSKDGGPGFIDSLFGYDDTQRKAAYALLYEDAALIASIPKRPGNEKLFFERTTDIAQSSRERTQAAGFGGWTEPTSNEMGLALMRVALNTGGRQISTSIVSVGTAFDRMGFDVFSGSL